MEHPRTSQRLLVLVTRLVGGYCRDLVHLAWTFDPRLVAADYEARLTAEPDVLPATIAAGPTGLHPERPAGHLPLSTVERRLWADLAGTDRRAWTRAERASAGWRAARTGEPGDPRSAWSGWTAGRGGDLPR